MFSPPKFANDHSLTPKIIANFPKMISISGKKKVQKIGNSETDP